METLIGINNHVLELSHGLITIEKLFDIYNNSFENLYIKGECGSWIEVKYMHTTNKTDSFNIVTKDGIHTIVGLDDYITMTPSGTFENPSTKNKKIYDLTHNSIISIDNAEISGTIKLRDYDIELIAYIWKYISTRFYKSVNGNTNTYYIIFRDGANEYNTKELNNLERIFKINFSRNKNTRMCQAYIPVKSDIKYIIDDYIRTYNIDVSGTYIPSIIWKLDLDGRKKFWKYYINSKDAFPEFIDKTTGKHYTEINHRNYELTYQLKAFASSIGINSTIKYNKGKNLYSIIIRGEDIIAKLKDPFIDIIVDSSRNWNYNKWNKQLRKGRYIEYIQAGSRDRYFANKISRLEENYFYINYYNYYQNLKIKYTTQENNQLILLETDDKYISLNNMLIKKG